MALHYPIGDILQEINEYKYHFHNDSDPKIFKSNVEFVNRIIPEFFGANYDELTNLVAYDLYQLLIKTEPDFVAYTNDIAAIDRNGIYEAVLTRYHALPNQKGEFGKFTVKYSDNNIQYFRHFQFKDCQLTIFTEYNDKELEVEVFVNETNENEKTLTYKIGDTTYTPEELRQAIDNRAGMFKNIDANVELLFPQFYKPQYFEKKSGLTR